MIMNTASLLLLFAGLLVIVMTALSAAQEAGLLAPEPARKIFHIVMGLGTLPFPWLFADPAPVLWLAVLLCVWFDVVRRFAVPRRRCGAVLFAAGRLGRGEIYYVVGAALTFVIADGNALLFCLPMAILALADSAAALIGQHFNRNSDGFGADGKSFAGSGGFFAVALVASVVGLSLAGWAPAQAIGVSVLLALITALLEAVAGRGTDNLFVPLGAVLFLHGAPALSLMQVFAMTVFLALAIAATTVWPTAQTPGKQR